MNTTKAPRSLYWDMVKGLGIIAIVIGHAGLPGSAFVYLFHLALFFFVTGYLYNEEKYGDAPFVYFGVRLSGAWPRYLCYTVCFVLLHNFFVTRGLYANAPLYNHTMMLSAAANSVPFSSPEPVQGALWFVPVWLVSSALFAGTVWFGRQMAEKLSCPEVRLWASGAACAVIGLAGLFLNLRGCGQPYNLQAAYLVVPIYFAAWMMRLFLPDFKRFSPWYGCLASAVLLWAVNAKLHIFIDISAMAVPGLFYYPIALLGIYFTLSLAASIERFLPILSRPLAFLGKHSFDIMALHFTVFKLMDFVYARLYPAGMEAPGFESLAAFPVAFRSQLGYLYLLLGLAIPAVIGCLADSAAAWWKNGAGFFRR